MNSKKGRQVDSSIAQAYIQMIRNAENFIYIENQYFLGSACSWLQNDDVNCNHTIPVEIAQRIVEKIRMNQRFTTYVLIPMVWFITCVHGSTYSRTQFLALLPLTKFPKNFSKIS